MTIYLLVIGIIIFLVKTLALLQGFPYLKHTWPSKDDLLNTCSRIENLHRTTIHNFSFCCLLYVPAFTLYIILQTFEFEENVLSGEL